MSDLEWVFEINGNAKEALAQVDSILGSMPKNLGAVEDGLKKLERAQAAAAIAKLNDPLKQNIALAKLHLDVVRQEKEAQDRATKAAKDAADAQTKVSKDAIAKQREARAQIDAFNKATSEAQKKADKERHAALQQQLELQHKIAAASRQAASNQSAHTKAQAGGAASGILGAFGLGDVLKLGSVAGAAELIAESVAGLGKALASGGLSFLKFGIDAAEGKQAMLGALDTFEEGRTSKIFGILQDMGIAAGVSADKTVQAFADLRAAGFKAKEAQDIVAASFDVAAQKGGGSAGAAAADKFADTFTKLRALGKVGSRDLLTIARDIGISSDSLTDAMAARMKTTAEQARKTLAEGKADAGIVQNALMDVVQTKFDKGGPLGTKAKELAGNSITAPLQSLRDLVSNLFEDVNIKPFAGALQSVIAALKDDKIGGALQHSINRIFGLFGGLERLDFKAIFETAAVSIEKIVDGTEKLFQGFSKNNNGAADLGKMMAQAAEAMTLIQASGVGETLALTGTMLRGIAVTVGYFQRAWTMVKDTIDAANISLQETLEKISMLTGGAIDLTGIIPLPKGAIPGAGGAGADAERTGNAIADGLTAREGQIADIQRPRLEGGAVTSNSKAIAVNFNGDIHVGEGGAEAGRDVRDHMHREMAGYFEDLAAH